MNCEFCVYHETSILANSLKTQCWNHTILKTMCRLQRLHEIFEVNHRKYTYLTYQASKNFQLTLRYWILAKSSSFKIPSSPIIGHPTTNWLINYWIFKPHIIKKYCEKGSIISSKREKHCSGCNLVACKWRKPLNFFQSTRCHLGCLANEPVHRPPCLIHKPLKIIS